MRARGVEARGAPAQACGLPSRALRKMKRKGDLIPPAGRAGLRDVLGGQSPGYTPGSPRPAQCCLQRESYPEALRPIPHLSNVDCSANCRSEMGDAKPASRNLLWAPPSSHTRCAQKGRSPIQGVWTARTPVRNPAAVVTSPLGCAARRRRSPIWAGGERPIPRRQETTPPGAVRPGSPHSGR